MKIFGITYITKKALKKRVAELETELKTMKEAFPFTIGQIVYDVALKNAQGRYTTVNPSLEHSTISELVVNEKNYFKLIERSKRDDIFFDKEEAELFLKCACHGL